MECTVTTKPVTQPFMKPNNLRKALADKIATVQTSSEGVKVERSITRIFNAGLLTVSEFRRLDVRLMEKIGRLS